MSVARSIATLLSIIPSVLVRRSSQGRKRPSWGLAFEIFATFMQKETQRLSLMSTQQMREYRDKQALQSRLLKIVQTQKVEPEGQSAQWFIPPQHHDAIILYFHGGGYTYGSILTHNDLMARLALSSGARVLGVEYRLAPEAPFPAAVEDALAAYRYLLAQGNTPQKIIVMGDSAGGGLSLSLLLRLREEGLRMPAGAALLCPWVDLTCTSASFEANAAYDYISREGLLNNAAHYLQGASPRQPLASPLFADLRGLSPIYIQAGGAEVLLQDALSLTEKLRAEGVEVRCEVTPDMLHDWQLFGYLFAVSREAVDRLAAFVIEKTFSA
jgi:epsilon-lactone hydrolase